MLILSGLGVVEVLDLNCDCSIAALFIGSDNDSSLCPLGVELHVADWRDTLMKKLSKIVALLLAGAMAMLMFTACTGGGGSADTQKEEAIRKQLGTKSEAVKLCDNDGKVKNDSKLYKETAELLDARIKAETSAFGILLVDFDVKGVNPAEQYVTVTLSADYKTAGLVAGLVNLITEKLGKIDATNSFLWLCFFFRKDLAQPLSSFCPDYIRPVTVLSIGNIAKLPETVS